MLWRCGARAAWRLRRPCRPGRFHRSGKAGIRTWVPQVLNKKDAGGSAGLETLDALGHDEKTVGASEGGEIAGALRADGGDFRGLACRRIEDAEGGDEPGETGLPFHVAGKLR